MSNKQALVESAKIAAKKKRMRENVTLVIKIKGDSARKLLAVGPEDLRDFFLPERFGVQKTDVDSIKFTSTEVVSVNKTITTGVHPSNF